MIKNTLRLFIVFILGFFSTAKAQFPGFVHDEWKPYFVDSSILTKSYRDLFGLGNTIVPALAYNLGEYCDDSIRIFRKRIDSLSGFDKKVTNPTSNAVHQRIAILEDSVVVYRKAGDYFYAINKFTGKPKWTAKFIPIKLKEGHAEFFYFGESENSDAKGDLFSDVVLQSSIKKNIISSEVIAAYLPKIPVRFGLRTTVIDDNDSTSEQKVSNKVLYGGLINVDLLYPLFLHNSRFLTMYVPLSGRLSIDRVPVNQSIGTKDNESLLFGSASIDVYIRAPFNTIAQKDGTKPRLAFFANGRLSYLDGADRFYDNIQLVGNRYGFFVAQVNAGLEINNKLRIGINVPVWTTNDNVFVNKQVTVGIQIDPKFLKAD